MPVIPQPVAFMGPLAIPEKGGKHNKKLAGSPRKYTTLGCPAQERIRQHVKMIEMLSCKPQPEGTLYWQSSL